MKLHLTKAIVEGLKPSVDGSRTEYFDDKLPGFGVRVSTTRKTYFVIGRLKGIAPTLRAAGVKCSLGSRTYNEGKKIVLQKKPVTVSKISDMSDISTEANNHAALGHVDISAATKNSDIISDMENPNNHAGFVDMSDMSAFLGTFTGGTNSKMPGIRNVSMEMRHFRS
jgi:hypothetical protein